MPAPEAWVSADHALHEKDLPVQECAGFYEENGKGGER